MRPGWRRLRPDPPLRIARVVTGGHRQVTLVEQHDRPDAQRIEGVGGAVDGLDLVPELHALDGFGADHVRGGVAGGKHPR